MVTQAPAPISHAATPRPAVRDRSLPATTWIWALAFALFALYTVVSVRTHQRMLSTGFDLGIFEQAVRSYAEGQLPVAELKGPEFALLGDHFSPALALLAPLYLIFPSPLTLLVAQAALLAVAVVPLAGYAQRTIGRGTAVVVGVGYGLSWGIAQAVGFDFHEVAFAVPLIAFCAVALGERRLTAAVLWALPLLLVKEDLGLTVAMVGGLVAWLGARALGAATIAVGLVGSALEVLVVLPAVNDAGTFAYWDELRGGGEGGTGVAALAERATVGLISPEPKAVLLILLLAPTAFVALRSPLLLLALPTLGWRLFSEYSMYWGTGYHYSAVLMPVVFVAFVDGLRRWAHPGGGARLRDALVVSVGVTALLLPSYPLWDAVEPTTWKDDPRVRDARAVLGRIPDDARVSATNRLAPQLVSRAEVSLFGHPDARNNPEYIVIDMARGTWPISLAQQEQLVEVARQLGYATAAEQGDFLLLQRDPRDSREFPPPPEAEEE